MTPSQGDVDTAPQGALIACVNHGCSCKGDGRGRDRGIEIEPKPVLGIVAAARIQLKFDDIVNNKFN